jgi:hypothetical protein
MGWPTTINHRVLRPQSANRLALEKPNQSPLVALTRHVEQIGWGPSEMDRLSAPTIEEQASGENQTEESAAC